MQLISPADYVENFLKNFDKEIIVIYSDKFNYNVYNHAIHLGLDLFTENNPLISNPEYIEEHIFLLKLNGYDFEPYCSYETFNLLHEMGHAQMRRLYKNFNFIELVKKYLQTQELYNIAYDNEEIDDFELQELHMSEPLEKDANAWAYQFILENKEIVKQFDKQFMNLMGAMIR